MPFNAFKKALKGITITIQGVSMLNVCQKNSTVVITILTMTVTFWIL